MDNSKNMNVDMEEFNKQRKEEIINKGQYISLEIMVEKDNYIPFSRLELNKCGAKEMAMLVVIMNEITDKIKKEYPEAYFISKFMGATTESFGKVMEE